MSKPITISNTFQTQPGPIPLSQLDANFTQVAGSLNDMGTYSNYLVDSGAVNALVVTTAVGLTFAYNAGMRIEVKVANTNTSTGVTINVNSLGAKNIVNPSGSALAVGQLVAGEIALLMYDGTNFQLLSASSALPPLTGPILLPDGTAGAPALSFSADTDVGLYRIGANDLGFSTGGTLRFDISTTALTATLPFIAPAGSAGAPGFAFTGSTNTGIFLNGAGEIDIAAGGVAVARVISTVFQIDQIAKFIDGTAGAPALAFSADTDTGFYRAGSNAIGIAALGANIGQFTANAFGELRMSDGNVVNPSYSFLSDTDTGIFRIGSNDLGFSVGGGARFHITSTAFESTVVGFFTDGTVSAPSLAFSSDTDTGIYRPGSDTIAFSTGGIFVGSFNSSQQFAVVNGSVSAPTICFNSDGNTGFYHTVIADNIGVSCGGTLVATFKPTQILGLDGNIATGAAYAFNSNPLSGLYSSGSGQVGITVNGSGGLSLFDPSLGGNIASLGFNSSTSLRFNCTGASSATTGASGAPPAQVAGYMTIQHNGSSFKIPYYNV